MNNCKSGLYMCMRTCFLQASRNLSRELVSFFFPFLSWQICEGRNKWEKKSGPHVIARVNVNGTCGKYFYITEHNVAHLLQVMMENQIFPLYFLLCLTWNSHTVESFLQEMISTTLLWGTLWSFMLIFRLYKWYVCLNQDEHYCLAERQSLLINFSVALQQVERLMF